MSRWRCSSRHTQCISSRNDFPRCMRDYMQRPNHCRMRLKPHRSRPHLSQSGELHSHRRDTDSTEKCRLHSCFFSLCLCFFVVRGFASLASRLIRAGCLQARALLVGPREAASDNALHNEVVCGWREAPADSEVELPLRRKIEVDGGENLVLLLAQRVKFSRGASRAVILDSTGDLLRDVVTDLHGRRESPALVDIQPVQGPFKSRIEAKVPGAEGPVDDWAQLIGPGVGREGWADPADLLRDADANRPVPLLRNRKPWPDVVSHPLPSAVRLDAAEHVKTRFKPVVETLRDLESFVLGVMRRLDTVDDGFAPIHREIGMDLDHRGARRNEFGGVHLNFVVVLSETARCDYHRGHRDCEYASEMHRLPLPTGSFLFRLAS